MVQLPRFPEATFDFLPAGTIPLPSGLCETVHETTLEPTSPTARRVVELSARLFPGPVSVEHASDPDDASHEYLVFDVVAQGEYAAYRERIFTGMTKSRRLFPIDKAAID